MEQHQKVIIVTGANMGLGYALVAKLVQQYLTYRIILAARNLTRGEEAYKKILQKYPNAKNNLFLHKLDIRNPRSQDEFYTDIKNTCQRVDILVNNAGISHHSHGVTNTYDDIFGTNYHATVAFTEKMLPLLAEDGRIIMVSSIMGQLSNQSAAYRKFLAQPLTEEKINTKLKEVEQTLKAGKHSELAPMYPIYASSKAFLNAYVRWVLAPKMKAGQTAVTIHPGWCKTECSGQLGSKTAEEGTKTALYLIGLDNQRSRELNGKYFDDETNVIDY